MVDDLGANVLALADRLAAWSETGDSLTCTYLSAAHRAVAQELARLMEEAGMSASIDAVGNVVGRYASLTRSADAGELRSRDPVSPRCGAFI
jgi:hypothetical protein